MSNDQADYFERLEIGTLTNLLLDPGQPAEMHNRAFHALTRAQPEERRARVAQVMSAAVRSPQQYSDDLIIAMIEILGTDPHPDATESMVQVLPDVLEIGLTNPSSLSRDVREYFYEALVTRSREGDLAVWGELLPALDGKTLVAMMLEPAAQALEALEPMTLISRLPEPDRMRALVSLIAGLARSASKESQVEAAAKLLVETPDERLKSHAIAILQDRWEKSRKSGRSDETINLEKALGIVDVSPRTAAERLRGRRPWAP